MSLEQPNDEYWYAFGRIAEEFGENQIAETEYKKLKKPKEESSLPTSTYTLAQKRLRQMQGSAASRTTAGGKLMSLGSASERDATFFGQGPSF